VCSFEVVVLTIQTFSIQTMDPKNLLKGLAQMTIADVWPNRAIIWVGTTCTLQECLELFKTSKVLSFPVVDVSTNSCIGVVDILDLVLFIVASFPSINSITYDILVNLEYNGRRFLQETSLVKVIAFSKAWEHQDLPQFPFKLKMPLIELMNTFSSGIHRVPVVDDNNQILNFISQMDLLRFLAQNIYLLEERGIGKKTLDELGIGRRSVHFVRSDAMVLLAMSSMTQHKVHAVPILDKETGKLIANFSASDLRGIGPGDLHQLLRPLISFLAIFNVKSLFPLTCKPSDTLEYTLLKLAGSGVHRLWVTDDNHQLLGVIGLTEVMAPFLEIEPMQLSFVPVRGSNVSGINISG